MSTIIADNLTGKTSAGSVTVTSEGGAATQSLQQGLAKMWADYRGTGTVAVNDSLNVTSLTDVATGRQTCNLGNNMNSASHSIGGSCVSNNNYYAIITSDTVAKTTSTIKAHTRHINNTAYDISTVSVNAFGDLA